jgi:alpha-tubulin suppressor-like RCC1 family protein
VATCGNGDFGRLGHGGTRGEVYPTRVEALTKSKVKQVACGGAHTVAVTGASVVLLNPCVQCIDHWNLELSSAEESLTLTATWGLGCHWLVAEDGRVLTWGMNDHGQLGHSAEAAVCDVRTQSRPTVVG